MDGKIELIVLYMKNNVFWVIIPVFFTNLLSCTNENDNKKDVKRQAPDLSISGSWYDVKDSNNIMELKLVNDSLIEGVSCFIFQNGDRIDCSETKNISLAKESDNNYSGNFYSDYMSDTLRVKVVINKTLNLIFVDPYDFGDQMTFRK